ncbi:MAG: hypothetical protein HOC74_42545 [Gemmatimonadetes bacterium]|nr:hypothetical protein [Gemmatimonadota bacterium]
MRTTKDDVPMIQEILRHTQNSGDLFAVGGRFLAARRSLCPDCRAARMPDRLCDVPLYKDLSRPGGG